VGRFLNALVPTIAPCRVRMQSCDDVSGAREFSRAISLQPLVSKLEFTTNKTSWGHNLRMTPKRISARDAKTILREVE